MLPLQTKEVILLSTRERIMTIRLLDKILKHPLYAKALGIEGIQQRTGPGDLNLSEVSELNRNQ